MVTDEPLWINRSTNFYSALDRFDWGQTLQNTDHPGVTTTWLSGFTLSLYNWCVSSGLFSWNFRGYLSAGSLATALTVSAGIVLVYFLLRELFGERAAILGALLVALDPFLIAYSRVMHPEALLAIFMLLSVLALMAYLNKPRGYLIVAAGALMGLAILSKITALFLIPFTALIVTAWYLSNGKPASGKKALDIARVTLAVISVALLIFCLLLPAMWVDPAGTIQKLSGGFGSVSTQSKTLSIGYFTTSLLDNWWFYPGRILMEMTPVSLVFSVVCLGFLCFDLVRFRLTRTQKNVIILGLFVVLFILQMTIGYKKATRYVLTALLPIDVLAAIGLCYIIGAVKKYLPVKDGPKNLKKALAPAAIIVILMIQVIPLALIHPYYLADFNPVVFGGPSHAPNIITIGWGEGLDLAATYLNGKPNADHLVAAIENAPIQIKCFTPFFKGKTVTYDDLKDADYVVFYIKQMQFDNYPQEWAFYRNMTPEKVITINGIDYCWIYKNRIAGF